MKVTKWLLVLIGAYSVVKAIRLLSTPVDGAGIGLYVGFLEINDRLPQEQIPMTAAIFAAMGLISLLAAFAFHRLGTRGG